MRKWLLIPLVFIIISCDQPAMDMIREDFQRIHPKAQIVLINPVEKSSDSYRVIISYRADTSHMAELSDKFYEDVFLYKKIDGRWVNTWQKSGDK
jgi:hypothetical protein